MIVPHAQRVALSAMRRLFPLVAAVVLVDTMFFAAVAPLLPHYSDELGLSKSAAGVLAAAYPAGTLVGSLPAGWLAARVGVKPTVLLGPRRCSPSRAWSSASPRTCSCSTSARFAQGVGGACSWAGGLAWLVCGVAGRPRGTVIGSALGAAIVGVLLGPALGGLATAAQPGARVQRRGRAGRGPGRVGVDDARRAAGARAPGCAPSARALRRPVGDRRLLAVHAARDLRGHASRCSAPLRLDELGASGAAHRAVFLLVAGVEAVLSPWSGRLSDRHGRLAPIRVGLAGAVVMAALLPLPETVVLMAFALLAAVAALGAFWAPAMALLSDASEAAGLDQALAFGLANLAWASGHMAGQRRRRRAGRRHRRRPPLRAAGRGVRGHAGGAARATAPRRPRRASAARRSSGQGAVPLRRYSLSASRSCVASEAVGGVAACRRAPARWSG